MDAMCFGRTPAFSVLLIMASMPFLKSTLSIGFRWRHVEFDNDFIAFD
jgi:hypothetical protein